MSENELINSLKNEVPVFQNHDLVLEEIGDGNINKVYRAQLDDKRTFIVKAARKQANISDDIKLNISRGKLESDYLMLSEQITESRVPHLYFYSKTHRFIVMQDMGNSFNVLQKEIAGGKKYDFLAYQLAKYTADMSFSFSDFSLPSNKKKSLQKRFINPRLCKLTEDLVFTEPYHDCKNNSFTAANENFVKREIYSDNELKKKAAESKFRFMNCPQTLIHGDLHFGSIFVSNADIVVFDPEFCFFGPLGYDIGNLLAHFLLQSIYACLKGKKNDKENAGWLKQSAAEMIEKFEELFSEKAEKCEEASFRNKEFQKAFLSSVLNDTAAYAGTECIRRVVGLAKVSCFEFIDEEQKAQYEREALKTGKYLLVHSNEFMTADGFNDYLLN